MNDPYLILEVAEDADDATIHRAYLQKVRAFPPERAPARFQAIRRAYETLRDERVRRRHRLFPEGPPPATDLLAAPASGNGRPDLDTLLAALDWSLRAPGLEDGHG